VTPALLHSARIIYAGAAEKANFRPHRHIQGKFIRAETRADELVDCFPPATSRGL